MMKNRRRSSFKRLFLLAVALCSLLLSGNTVQAALVTYSFTGNVGNVAPVLSGTFNNTQSMSGSITVNMLDNNLGNNRLGNYTVTNFNLNIGGYNATMGSAAGEVVIRDRVPPAAALDTVSVNVNADGPMVNFLGLRLFDVDLRGPSNTFSGDALPMTPPSISSFTNFNRFRLVFGPVGMQRVVSGTLANIAAVPLPAAVILFGAGLVALVGLGAGGLRNLRKFQA